MEEVIDTNDTENECMIVQEDSPNNSQTKANYNLRSPKTTVVEVSSEEEEDKQKHELIFEKKILKRGRPSLKKVPNYNLVKKLPNYNLVKKVPKSNEKDQLQSLLKWRNACVQVAPSSKDISIQTNLSEGNVPFKNRILNTTINLLQRRVLNLEQKLRKQTGALWMKKKKLAQLKEQNKELCQKLSGQSMNAVESALKEVLHEYFKDSVSPEDAVNKSKQLCLHANILFKKK